MGFKQWGIPKSQNGPSNATMKAQSSFSSQRMMAVAQAKMRPDWITCPARGEIDQFGDGEKSHWDLHWDDVMIMDGIG